MPAAVEQRCDRRRDLVHLRHRADFFRRDVARDLDRHRQPWRPVLVPPAVAREHGRMRRKHAFGAARPHEGDLLADFLGRDTRCWASSSWYDSVA